MARTGSFPGRAEPQADCGARQQAQSQQEGVGRPCGTGRECGIGAAWAVVGEAGGQGGFNPAGTGQWQEQSQGAGARIPCSVVKFIKDDPQLISENTVFLRLLPGALYGKQRCQQQQQRKRKREREESVSAEKVTLVQEKVTCGDQSQAGTCVCLKGEAVWPGESLEREADLGGGLAHPGWGEPIPVVGQTAWRRSKLTLS